MEGQSCSGGVTTPLAFRPFGALFKQSEAPSTGGIRHPPKSQNLLSLWEMGEKITGSQQIRIVRKCEYLNVNFSTKETEI